MKRISIALFFILLQFVFGNDDIPTIEIEQGVLQGKYKKSFKGRKFSSFTGIPYAKPPVGDLRFKPPVPAEPWEGILDASQSHPMCPQMNVYLNDYTPKGEEDCLYLNVYTPQLPDSNKKRLPVLFFVHGGGFMNGKSEWYGPGLLLDQDIVLVATNYRVGALGFITTGDEIVPGNNGLKDQNFALQWTKKNIEHFGGDPNRITVFGQSAGGASAHYHTLSPLSKGLISGAIMDSGTALCSWSFGPTGQGVRNTKRLAEFLDCPTSCNHKMVECLRNVNASKIVEQDVKFLEWGYTPMTPFKPVVEPDLEGAFLTEHPIDIIKSGKAADVPIMTGLTTEDGALKSIPVYSTGLIKELDEDFNRIAPIALQYHETAEDKDQISEQIRKFYFGDKKIDNTTKNEVTNMFTDEWFLLPEDSTVRLHYKNYEKPVYYFLFSYRGTASFGELFGDDPYDFGVSHCDELLYLFDFGTFFPNYKRSEADKKMIDVLTRIWANFAKTGNPNLNKSVVEWKPVRSESLEYYNIKAHNDMSMEENLYADRVKFWRNLPIEQERTQIRDEL